MNEQVAIWLWDDANNVWEKAPAVVITKRMVAVGQVVPGAHKLYWITMNGGAGNTHVELSDDTDGSTAIVHDMNCLQNCALHVVLSPPMPFTTGIYLKTYTNAGSVCFGYI